MSISEDAAGITIRNSTGTNAVSIATTGATELTIAGDLKFSSHNLNLNENQALGFRLENLSSAPTAGNAGRLIWNTTSSAIQFDDGAAFQTFSATGLSGLTSSQIEFATGSTTIGGDANFTWDNTNKIFVLGGSATTRHSHTAGTLATGTNAVVLTATHPSSSSTETGVLETITSAGTGVVNKIARALTFAAGYTSAGTSTALQLTNSVAGTGASLSLGTSVTIPLGNLGLNVAVNASTATGYNICSFNEAANSLTNVGSIGKATTATNATNNVGVIGSARSATNNVAGYFTLSSTDTPTFTSAALIADNGATGSSVFVGKVNGTAKVSVDGTGNLLTDTVLPQTSAGTIAHTSNGGVSVKAGNGTQGVLIRTLQVTTTNTASATEMTFDGSSATGSNTLQLANNTAHLYVVWITARGTAGTNSGLQDAWRLEFLVNGDTGTAAEIGTTGKTIIAKDVAGWDVTVTVTSSRVQVNAVGDAASTINWVAVVQEIIAQ